MPKVALVGTGLIGRSFAMVFARAGWDVALYDPVSGAADAARRASIDGLAMLESHGLCDDPAAAGDLIRVERTVVGALDGAKHVQESGPEALEVKRALFADLDTVAHPDAVLASSTSALQCSLFTETLSGRHRCLVAHPVNPPHLVPVVELSGAPWTAPDTIEKSRSIFESVGQAPITVLREIDGFILNRLQAALLTEAFRLVRDGVVSPADLDRTISHGLGRRWSFMGPFQTIALNAPGGVPDYCKRYAPFFRRFADAQGSSEVWTEENIAAVADVLAPPAPPDEQTERTANRDAKLAALAAHFRC